MKFWRRKVFHGWRNYLRNQITSSNRKKCRHTRKRLRRTGWIPTWAFDPKNIGPNSHQIWYPSISACGRILRKSLQDTPQKKNRWAQCFCEHCMVVDEERLRQEGLQELLTSIKAYYCRQRWPHWTILCVCVLIYRYITKIVYFHAKLRYYKCLKFTRKRNETFANPGIYFFGAYRT